MGYSNHRGPLQPNQTSDIISSVQSRSSSHKTYLELSPCWYYHASWTSTYQSHAWCHVHSSFCVYLSSTHRMIFCLFILTFPQKETIVTFRNRATNHRPFSCTYFLVTGSSHGTFIISMLVVFVVDFYILAWFNTDAITC